MSWMSTRTFEMAISCGAIFRCLDYFAFWLKDWCFKREFPSDWLCIKIDLPIWLPIWFWESWVFDKNPDSICQKFFSICVYISTLFLLLPCLCGIPFLSLGLYSLSMTILSLRLIQERMSDLFSKKVNCPIASQKKREGKNKGKGRKAEENHRCCQGKFKSQTESLCWCVCVWERECGDQVVVWYLFVLFNSRYLQKFYHPTICFHQILISTRKCVYLQLNPKEKRC